MSSFWQELSPYLGEALGEIARDASIAYARHMLRTTAPPAVQVRPALAPANPEHACPYCEIARRMAIIHRYLRRAADRPALGMLYHRLAALEVSLAAEIAASLPEHANNHALQRRVHRLDVALAAPVRDPADLARQAWDAGEIALGLAESGLPHVPVVIEGEAEEVGNGG